jgi:hypothetical protein
VCSAVVLGGETLSVPPDGSALRAIADATGGRYNTAWFVGAGLAALLLASALALAWFARLP